MPIPQAVPSIDHFAITTGQPEEDADAVPCRRPPVHGRANPYSYLAFEILEQAIRHARGEIEARLVRSVKPHQQPTQRRTMAQAAQAWLQSPWAAALVEMAGADYEHVAEALAKIGKEAA